MGPHPLASLSHNSKNERQPTTAPFGRHTKTPNYYPSLSLRPPSLSLLSACAAASGRRRRRSGPTHPRRKVCFCPGRRGDLAPWIGSADYGFQLPEVFFIFFFLDSCPVFLPRGCIWRLDSRFRAENSFPPRSASFWGRSFVFFSSEGLCKHKAQPILSFNGRRNI